MPVGLRSNMVASCRRLLGRVLTIQYMDSRWCINIVTSNISSSSSRRRRRLVPSKNIATSKRCVRTGCIPAHYNNAYQALAALMM